MTVYRTDYKPYPYDLPRIELEFDLDAILTTVQSRIEVQAKPETPTGEELVLDGQEIELVDILVDGRSWTQYHFNDQRTQLTLIGLPRQCTLQITSTCKPNDNSALMGLYVSGKSLFTQCEAEGFRRICWFADRPDVMSQYQVTLRACP